MKWWVLYLWIILLFVTGVVIFKVYPNTTGKLIFWQNSDFSDSANPRPQLSPIPVQSPLTEIPSVTVNCDDAKKTRDKTCKTFTDKYSGGCKWYHFSWIFDCNELKNACSEAQDKVSNECR